MFTPPELIFAAVLSPRRRFLEFTIGPLFNLFSPQLLDVTTVKKYSKWLFANLNIIPQNTPELCKLFSEFKMMANGEGVFSIGPKSYRAKTSKAANWL
jgi:hypothetical protein